MSEIGTHIWEGFGDEYEYSISRRPPKLEEEWLGNYIFAKIVNEEWHAVYVGQGALFDRYNKAVKEGCVDEKGATHYHFRLNDKKHDREMEERDLIAGNPECKWPEGCNGHDPGGD